MLDSATQSDRHVAIVHTFAAPPELVWAAWADPVQVAQWWGPDGFETPLDSVVVELRPGGRFELLMRETRTGDEFPVRQEILEVSEPSLLVMRHEAVPEHGLLEPILTRLEFHPHEGGTRLELTGGPYPAEMGPNAAQGWVEQLDKLARVLSA